jgi:methionine-rich copper-binding protein CopC
MRIARFAAAAAVAMALSCLIVSSVSAHARYKSSTPGKGEVLSASPARVEVMFTQEIQKVSGTYSIEANKDRGASVTAGTAVVDESDRHKLSVALQPNLAPGRYVVMWKNTSDEDGDPADGAFSFYVNAQPNAVDLENDKQLESVGAEEETPGTESASASASTGTPPSTAVATPRPAASVSPVATATPTSSDSGGGNGATIAIIAVVVVAIVAVAGAGAWYAMRRT